MKKEDLYFEKRSDLLGEMIRFVKLCNEVNRNAEDEINDLVFESLKEN